jgi:hypothetical protein
MATTQEARKEDAYRNPDFPQVLKIIRPDGSRAANRKT